MRDILVESPEPPEVGLFCSPAFCVGCDERDCFADTWPSTPLLVLSFSHVVVMVKDVGDFPPVGLDPTEPFGDGRFSGCVKDVLERAVLASSAGAEPRSQMSTKWRAIQNKIANPYVIDIII